MYAYLKKHLQDLIRVGVLMGLVGALLLLVDPANIVVVQALGISMFMVGGTHLTRRIMFHRIDLQSMALKVIEEKNVAGAVVFASIMGFLAIILLLPMLVLK